MKALPAELIGKNGGPLRKALAAGARLIRNKARMLVRVGRGDGPHLRDKIIMVRDKDPRRNGAAERYTVTVKYKARKYTNNKGNRLLGRVGNDRADYGTFFYWRFLEFGTSNAPAHPFMKPAFETEKHAAYELIKSTLAADLQRIAKKLTKK